MGPKMKQSSVLILAGALALPSAVAADDVRHLTFPSAMLGTWAETADQCASNDPSNVSIESAKYGDSSGNCAVRWIVETPGSRGTNYAVHALCTSTADPSQKETVNIIVRPEPDGRATMGRSFNALKSYQRCPAK
jgi:hypothetical protein